MPRSTRFAPLLPFLVLSGCYHYVVAGGRPLPQGTPVRIQLRAPRSFELSTLTANGIGVVTAELVRLTDEELAISARWLEAPGGQGFSGEGWTFRIPSTEVARLEVRTLSVWRTGVTLAGALLATYLGFEALGGSDGSSGSTGGGGVPR